MCECVVCVCVCVVYVRASVCLFVCLHVLTDLPEPYVVPIHHDLFQGS